jgi:hypothetical protein
VEAARPESLKKLRFAPCVPICAYVPPVPVFRSTLKPVSLVELSVQARLTVLDERATARRPVGGSGVGDTTFWTVILTDCVTGLCPGLLSVTLTVTVQVVGLPGAVQVTGPGPEVVERLPQVADQA